jgi:hypothetical protein
MMPTRLLPSVEAFFLVTSAVSLACLRFVRTIYAAIKID